MESKNISQPDSEYISKAQELAIDIINISYNIDMGDNGLVNEYVAKIRALALIMLPFSNNKELEDFVSEPIDIKGLSRKHNFFLDDTKLCITDKEEFNAYMKKLNKFRRDLFDIMKQNNFLVKVTDKRVRLT